MEKKIYSSPITIVEVINVGSSLLSNSGVWGGDTGLQRGLDDEAPESADSKGYSIWEED